MTNQRLVILSGALLFIVVFLVGYLILNPKEDRNEIKKEIELIVKKEQLVEKVKQSKIEKDSLLNTSNLTDTLIIQKKENTKLIKPKYDKKIKTITTSPADSISRFIIDRYNI